MVSTRGIRYKFSEGERVLCYEPDPTKAKVLYDSKVLEVIESKDKRGRRTVEYLIHFQGWNSSWDRCVSEDFVLKDTEENRQLQRDLAEKSQLQLGAYLYRRERKKGPVGPAAKRVRHGFSDDGSSTSTQPDATVSEAETAGEGDTDSSQGSSGSQVSTPPPGRATINLPPALRDRLTFDYHLVTKRGRLAALPASPSAAEILESFVKWFARSGAWRPARPARVEPPQRPDLRDVCCRLNLVREVADGLRVYFDFALRGQLLYPQEARQHRAFCGPLSAPRPAPRAASTAEEEDRRAAALGKAAVEESMKSPKIPEYSHLPPDPEDNVKSEASASPTGESEIQSVNGNTSEGASAEEVRPPAPAAPPPPPVPSNGLPSGSRPKEERVPTRRLRSHKSETDEPAPAAPAGEPRPLDALSSTKTSSAGSSSSSSGWRPPAPPAAPPPPQRTPLSLLLDKVAKWQIIPREGTEQLPCRVYGAIHLARLFVKLPDFLNATQMPDMKLKLILKHIDMFVQFLDEHDEWFGEMYYVANNVSRSHQV